MADQEQVAFDLESSLLIYEASNDFARQLGDQNKRYDEVQAIFSEDPEVRQLASEAIAEEQVETVAQILDVESAYSEVYRALGLYSCELWNRSQRTSEEMAAVKESSERKESELIDKRDEKHVAAQAENRAIEADVLRLAPRAVERVRQLLEQRTRTSADDAEIAALESELSELSQRLIELDASEIDVLAKTADMESIVAEMIAWPFPRAIMGVKGEDFSWSTFIDELPVEPVLNRMGHEHYEELRRRHVDQPEAAIFTSLYLSEHTGQTVTVDELIDFLYSTDAIAANSNYHMRARVTTILGPETGTAVRSILANEGYVLQYGWRKLVSLNGNQKIVVKGIQRIYRALRLSELVDMAPTTYETPEFIDVFDVTPDLKAQINEARLLTKVLQSVGLDSGNSGVDDRKPESGSSKGPITAGRGPEPTTLPPAPRVAASRQRATSQGRTNTANDQPPEPESIPTETAAGDWEKDFQSQIGKVISELEEQGLLVKREGAKIAQIRARGASRVFGTRTALERLVAANLISKTAVPRRNDISQVMLTPVQMIITKLFNTSPEILGKGSTHQKRAVEVIEHAVESYFRHREKNDGSS